ncbi:MAG: zf-TFIIB domain-containing protein [Terracidiphilus sp.]
MNCPSCGGAITLKPDTEGYKCDYCHQVFFPGEEDDVQVADEPAQSSLMCPVCSANLVEATISATPVLFCSQCRGLLLPMHVLPSLVDELRSGRTESAVQTSPDRGDMKRTLQCPKCHRRMETHFYAGPGNVIVDSCGDCFLIWLDRGELTRIVRAPDETDAAESTW